MPVEGEASSCPMARKKEDEKTLKPCCACPETRKARDECVLLKGSEEACWELIEAHRQCLRSYGFDT